jgi:hypothetical protein
VYVKNWVDTVRHDLNTYKAGFLNIDLTNIKGWGELYQFPIVLCDLSVTVQAETVTDPAVSIQFYLSFKSADPTLDFFLKDAFINIINQDNPIKLMLPPTGTQQNYTSTTLLSTVGIASGAFTRDTTIIPVFWLKTTGTTVETYMVGLSVACKFYVPPPGLV